MNKLAFRFFILLVAAISFSSCSLLKKKPSKKARAKAERAKQVADSINLSLQQSIATDSSQITVSADSMTSLDSLLEQTSSIWQKRLECTTMSTKAKMHYDGGDKSLDFTANIRLKKDSIIWVSITVAGLVQVGRAIITPDSFKAVMYTEREAYVGPISKASQILPEGLDFYSLQNLLLGNPILQNVKANFAQEESNVFTFRFLHNNYLEQVHYSKTDSMLIANQLITQNNISQSLNQSLNNISSIGNKKFATDRKLSIVTEKNTLLVEMNLTNTAFDEELNYPFSIPKNYILK